MNRALKLYGIVFVGLLLLIASAMAQNSFKFGVVDTQKVFESYNKAKDADEVLKTAENRLRGELEAIREDIRTMEERLTKQKLFLDDPQTTSMENDIRLKKQDYQRKLEIGQESIMEKQKELVEPILKEIEGLIKQIGKDQGFSLILEKRLVTLYVDAKYDLTDNIIGKLNENHKKSGATVNPGESK